MSEIAKTVSVPKTLPMKYKCLMYGAIALWESLKAKGLVCESNFMDVVHFDVGEQIKFLDSMIDVNYLEKEVVKPLQKAHKKELADAKKEKKVTNYNSLYILQINDYTSIVILEILCI